MRCATVQRSAAVCEFNRRGAPACTYSRLHPSAMQSAVGTAECRPLGPSCLCVYRCKLLIQTIPFSRFLLLPTNRFFFNSSSLEYFSLSSVLLANSFYGNIQIYSILLSKSSMLLLQPAQFVGCYSLPALQHQKRGAGFLHLSAAAEATRA